MVVLFADVRGSTGLGERMGARDFAKLLNRFYAVANDQIVAENGMVDKMVGDEVMALFMSGPTGPDYRERAIAAGWGLLGALGYGSPGEPLLPVGVGVHAGRAFVGKVGSGNVNDFTALGDTVNIGARLQAEAQGGQLVVSDALRDVLGDLATGAEHRDVDVRGREETVGVSVLTRA